MVKKGQTVTWSKEPASQYTFGQEPVAISAEATSSLPVIYVSTDANVVTVANGKLHIAGVGEAKLQAVQTGDRVWEKAASAPVTVRISPRELSVKPIERTLPFGEKIPNLLFEYDGLLNAEDSLAVNLPDYDIYISGTKIWNPTAQLLPVGTHTLKPQISDLGVVGNYRAKALDGIIKVSSVASHTVSFAVKGTGVPLQGALVQIADLALTTDAEGKASVELPAGKYPYAVSAEGFAATSDVVDISDSDADIPVELKQLVHTLIYRADANGAIHGDPEQRVAQGEDAQPVAAAPKFGYRFAKWDDGSTDNPRQDRKVMVNKEVTAHFEKVLLTVSYSAGFGGKIEVDGRVKSAEEQKIDLGGSAKPVKALPDEDFAFFRME